MIFRVGLVLSLFGLLSLIKISIQSTCGKKLERGTIMCILSNRETAIESFDLTLCTHGVVQSSLECNDDRCSFVNPSDIEADVQWASPHMSKKVGTYLNLDKNKVDFLLSSNLRRSNTIQELVNFMQDKGLNFLMIIGTVENIGSSKAIQDNYLQFVEELADRLHAKGFHVGQYFTISSDTEFLFNFDVERMSNLVDWYQFLPARFSNDYMQPYTPLTSSYGDFKGTTKYWIEKVLQLIAPECLVVDVGPRIRKQIASGKEVEPGLGSLATRSVSRGTKVSDLCNKLYVNSKCKKYWDEESSTPWAVCGDDFYSFDDARSLKLKADLLQQYNVTGLLFWTADVTAPDNICEHGDPLSMLRAVQGFRQNRNPPV